MAKKTAEEKAEEKRARQSELPGVEREKIPAIEEAAERYVKLRDRRMSVLEDEIEAKQALLLAMTEARKKSYRTDDDRIVTVEPKQQVRVKKIEDKDAEVED